MNKLIKNLTARLQPVIKSSTRGTKINFLGHAYSQTTNTPVTENEIMNTLRDKLPGTKIVTVEDTSGGCGAMFNVSIEATEFKGLSVMKQHRLVYEVLNEQIKKIHGIHLETRIPK